MIVWQANLLRVLEAGGPRAVFCFQEIDEADAPEEMDTLKALVRKTHHVIGENTAVPILVPFHLGLRGQRQTPAAKGLALFTPNRVVNEAVIQLGSGLLVGVLNTHLPIDRLVTRSRRADVRHALRERALSYPVGAWIADTNTRHGWPRIVQGEKTVTDAGIDKAKAWGPADRRIVITDQRSVDLTIDGHNAHGARIRWERS